ncbi:MAG: hypothetical protein H0U71_09380 [Gammaproteobacteria bacterium]|nr:hypothetical protein [Gammaproteobacteria bacterium]
MRNFFQAKIFILILISCLIDTPSIFAQNGQPSVPANPAVTPPAVTAPKVINQSDGTQVTLQTFFCPQPNELIKNGLYWGTAARGWKSYSESFDNQIQSFVGAQWIGINVGKMVCIYKGNLATSFPITLQNDTLSIAPTGGLWGKDLGGYRNCHSTNVWDCPFIVKTQTVNIQQIYESLDFFKNKPNPLNSNSDGQ